jgi:hypothetical protein
MNIIETLDELEKADFSIELKAEILGRLQRLLAKANAVEPDYIDQAYEFFNSIALDFPVDTTSTSEGSVNE